jgi:PucR family transcriptional regulator, purine catabolism regulatory protein
VRKRLTVRQALGHPCLVEARAVAGHHGLERPVERVGVLDVTDLDAVQGGELVLTNAYALLSFDLSALVDRLWRSGASALGVKLSGYWAEVPEALARPADDHGFPLLVLPEGPFDEIVNPLLAAIADRQTEALRRTAELHDALTAAALREGGHPHAVVTILTNALRSPTAILGASGEVLASTGPGELWDSEELRRHAAHATDGGPIRLDDEWYLIAPIPGRLARSGAVCVQGVAGEDPFVRAAVAHAAVVAGLVLVAREQVERIHIRFERELLEDLVDRRLVEGDEATARAAKVGWPLDRPYVVLVAGRRPPADAVGRASSLVEGEHELAAVARSLGTVRPVRLFVRRPGVVVVAHLQADDAPREVVPALADRLAGLAETSRELSLAVSLPRQRVVDLADAFEEAWIAFSMAPVPGRVVHFEDLGPVRLLARSRDRRRMTSAARDLLGPLADGESARSRELLETLAALLARNMNLSVTAAHMFFHYNTVRHRLARLRELMGDRLETPVGRLALSLSVGVIRLAEAADETTDHRGGPPRGMATPAKLPAPS